MTSVSTLCRRASSAPQMAMRRSAPGAGLTISGAISAARIVRPFVGREGEGRGRGDQAAQELGQLLAGIAGVEVGQAAILAARQRLERLRR